MRHVMKWHKKIAIRQFFRDEATESEAHIIGKRIAEYATRTLGGFLDGIGDEADNMYDAIERLRGVNTLPDWKALKASDSTWDDMPPIKELDSLLDDFYDEADNLNIWVDPSAQGFEAFNLDAVGVVKIGTPLRILGKNKTRDSYDRVLVENVLNAGTDEEEVIINSKKNYYFITKNYVQGKSWAEKIEVTGHP